MSNSFTIWNRFLLNSALLIGSILVSSAIFETSLRALGYHGSTVFNIENTMFVDDPILNWRQIPGSISYFNNVTYQINERGFRDYLYQYKKSDDIFRIFLSSDSVGFGTNVNMQDSYPKILESDLNKMYLGKRIEVVNYSMPGLSLKQKFHLIELYASQYHPDLIIQDYVLNDIEFESKKDSRNDELRDCTIAFLDMKVPCSVKVSLEKSAFVFFIKNSIENVLQKVNHEDRRTHFYEKINGDYYHRIYSTEEKLDYLKSIYKKVGEYQNQYGVPIVIPIFPLIYEYRKYKWDDINTLIVNECIENKLFFVPLLEDFKGFDYNEMRVERGEFTHPSVKGNRVAAGAIARMLVKNNLLLGNRQER